MKAITGQLRERFWHESRYLSFTLRKYMNHVAEEDQPIRRGKSVRVIPVLFKLAVSVLMIIGVVAPTKLVHISGCGLKEPQGPAQGFYVVARCGRIVELISNCDSP